MSSPKAVFAFSIAYEPYVGGAEVALRTIAARSARQFVVFTLRFAATDARRDRVDAAEVVRVGPTFLPLPVRKVLFIPLAAFAAWRMRRRCGVVWAMMANHAGFSAHLFSRLARKPLLLTLQEGDDLDALLRRRSVRLIMPLFRSLFRHAVRIQCISRHLTDFAARFAPRDRIVVVPNGVDLGIFTDPTAVDGRETTRAEMGAREGERVLVTTSRLVAKNGVDRVIRAMPQLSNVRFVVIGEGDDRVVLEALAREMEVSDRVTFLGYRRYAELPRYLAASDAFVRLSRTEGLGNSFIEAMAVGIPVVCTAVGGIVDFARDGETAFVVGRPDDSGATAAVIERALAGEDRLTVAKAGRDLAIREYGWDGISIRMEEQFDRVGRAARPARVLIATGIFPPAVGGPATHSAAIAERLHRSGYAVRVVCFGEEADAFAAGFDPAYVVTRISRKTNKLVTWARYSIALSLAAARSDLIYAFDLTTAGTSSAFLARMFRIPFLLRIGGDPIWERVVERGRRFIDIRRYYESGLHLVDRPRLYRLLRLVVRSASHVSVDNAAMRDFYVERFGVSRERIDVVPNPVERRPEVARHFGDTFTFLYAGRFVSYKNLVALVRAFALVHTDAPHTRLSLIGEGPESEAIDREVDINRLGAAVSIEPRVTRGELARRIVTSAVLVAPALSEFNPNAALEALSLGRPIVISRGSGLSVTVPDAWQFDPFDVGSMAQAMGRMVREYETALEELDALPLSITWEDTLAAHERFVRTALDAHRHD